MDKIPDFRHLPFQQDDASVLERAKIRELLEYERYCRDYGLFDEAAACYSDDAQIHVSWFNGPAKDYWEQTKRATGAGSRHKIFSTAVFLRGEKAAAEMQVMMLSPRIKIEGCELDMISYARIIAQLVKQDGIWKIQYGDCVYERDQLLPAAPGQAVPPLPETAMQYRESYRNLCYVLSMQGIASGQDLPGDDQPETVQELYRKITKWILE